MAAPAKASSSASSSSSPLSSLSFPSPSPEPPAKRRKISETTPPSDREEDGREHAGARSPARSATLDPELTGEEESAPGPGPDVESASILEQTITGAGRLLSRTSIERLVPFPRPKQGETAAEMPLVMRVDVCEDGHEHKSRTMWHGSLFLKHPRGPEGGFPIGFIKGWMLPKPSTPTSEAAVWVEEWLKQGWESYEGKDVDMAEALRSLYNKKGCARTKAIAGQMGTAYEDALVFIEMIYIKEKDETTGIKFSNNGLLKYLFQMYYACFADKRIPKDLRPTGDLPFILEPALPLDDELAKAHWPNGVKPEDDSKAEQEMQEKIYHNLMAMYTGSSGYKVMVKDANVRGYFHTILGRNTDAAERLEYHLDCVLDD